MRALRFARYGPPDVLEVREVAEPSPAPGQAKVRVRAVALNALDWKIRAGHLRLVPLLAGPPRGIGFDFAGEIVGIGGGPTRRHVGERVFGSLLPFSAQGALAELITAPYERLLPIPGGVDDSVVATLPIAAGTALQALQDHAGVSAGQRVLITGAGGGVGHFAVQLAKHFGAHVTGVCGPRNLGFVRSLGADEVIDYTREEFTWGHAAYDVVFDAASVTTFWSVAPSLSSRGVYLNTSGSAGAVVTTVLASLVAPVASGRRAVPVALRNTASRWQRLLDLLLRGALRPHVDRVIPLEDVAGAQQAMETGHGTGKVVVRL